MPKPLHALTDEQSVYAFIDNRVKLEASRELAPALRMQLHSLLDEYSNMMERCGRWAIARYLCKRGYPVEFALMVLYW